MWRIRGPGGRRPALPWRLSVAEDGEEIFVYLIIAMVVVAAVIAAVIAVLSIGVFVLAAVAIAGGVWGLIMAFYNFFGVLVEAHKTVK